ncbi:MAG: TolC family protein [Candidatus Kryptoniota bacterium]
MEQKQNLYKLLILLVFFFLQLFAANAYSQGMTLVKAIELARQNNNRIKEYREKVIESRYEDNVASSNFFPKITLQGTYMHLNNPLIVDLTPIRQAIITLQANNQTEIANIYSILRGVNLTNEQKYYLNQQYYAALDANLPPFIDLFKKQNYPQAAFTIVQPIFTGGRLIAAKHAASSSKRAAVEQMQQINNEVIEETVKDYLTVLLLKQLVLTRENVLSAMRRHEREAENLYHQGLISKQDYLRAQVAVADARQNLIDEENKLYLAVIALKHVINVDDTLNISPVDSLVYIPFDKPISHFLEEAANNQPILKYISEKQNEAHDKYVAERGNLLPQVVAFGKYELFPQYLSTLEPGWAAGIEMSVTLFDGFGNYDKLESAKHLELEIQNLQQEASRQVDLWVNKSYRSMTDAKERYINLEYNISLAKENLRAAEEKFQSGLGTSTDVVDAELILEKESIERLQALFVYYSSIEDLYAAAGKADAILQIWKSL